MATDAHIGRMGILYLVIVGIAAGYIATKVMRVEANMIQTIAIGIVGALIGGFLLRMVLALTGWAFGILGAVLGAMALIWLWKTYGPKS